MNISELCERDVVSLASGLNLGKIDDFVFDEEKAVVTHLILYGKSKFFGLFGREDDTQIPWREIAKIGQDVVLVTADIPVAKKKSRLQNFFK